MLEGQAHLVLAREDRAHVARLGVVVAHAAPARVDPLGEVGLRAAQHAPQPQRERGLLGVGLAEVALDLVHAPILPARDAVFTAP